MDIDKFEELSFDSQNVYLFSCKNYKDLEPIIKYLSMFHLRMLNFPVIRKKNIIYGLYNYSIDIFKNPFKYIRDSDLNIKAIANLIIKGEYFVTYKRT